MGIAAWVIEFEKQRPDSRLDIPPIPFQNIGMIRSGQGQRQFFWGLNWFFSSKS